MSWLQSWLTWIVATVGYDEGQICWHGLCSLVSSQTVPQPTHWHVTCLFFHHCSACLHCSLSRRVWSFNQGSTLVLVLFSQRGETESRIAEQVELSVDSSLSGQRGQTSPESTCSWEYLKTTANSAAVNGVKMCWKTSWGNNLTCG